MNDARLEESGIRGGTSFGWVVLLGCVAHPNQLAAPSPFAFPRSPHLPKLLSLSTAPPEPIFQRQKGALLLAPKTAPRMQVP
jgi:hypothetical protein